MRLLIFWVTMEVMGQQVVSKQQLERVAIAPICPCSSDSLTPGSQLPVSRGLEQLELSRGYFAPSTNIKILLGFLVSPCLRLLNLRVKLELLFDRGSCELELGPKHFLDYLVLKC